MILESIAITIVMLATAAYAYLRYDRSRLYRALAQQREQVVAARELPLAAVGDARPTPSFARLLAATSDALPADTFATLKAEIETLVDRERSYLPTHKKGGTVAYETLVEKAPGVVALYHSRGFHQRISDIVGLPLVPTPLHDQSSLSVLYYDKPGDHIGWHYDHNFYRGRHFTVLLAIVNRGHEAGGLSAARLMAKMPEGEETIPTSPNTMVVFEGARVVHKVTPIAEGERRVMLSMTYCTDPRNTVLQGAARRIKDTAFFGIRALWT